MCAAEIIWQHPSARLLDIVQSYNAMKMKVRFQKYICNLAFINGLDLWPFINDLDQWPWPMTLKINRVHSLSIGNLCHNVWKSDYDTLDSSVSSVFIGSVTNKLTVRIIATLTYPFPNAIPELVNLILAIIETNLVKSASLVTQILR